MQQTQSQGQSQQQAALMQTPPNVMTIKDTLYLKDQLSWLILAMKKCSHFASECSDSEIAQAINKAGEMHERHYKLLLKHLQNNNTAEMQHVPQQTH
ncbi:hypothetical protein A8990_110165 [Paenibacillus taihuensis]|uniref:Coat F domain-containing protein n=1 Tax=Paenibacillus taihuensis TaxID=1156355 RepID=A0A3D9S3F3_9BACL|nr:hypothetical protein [Paenibacillus taihuensis]REE86555.1 hypothetical protein A8990_110165 [Paenibacillus taihuensis]